MVSLGMSLLIPELSLRVIEPLPKVGLSADRYLIITRSFSPQPATYATKKFKKFSLTVRFGESLKSTG